MATPSAVPEPDHDGKASAADDMRIIEEMARQLDWDRLTRENPPPQSWFDGDEPKPF